MHHNKLTSAAVFAITLLSTCTEEPEYGGFTSKSGMGTESSGSQSVTLDLGATTATATTITYRVGGTAALDGDYRLTTLSAYYADALTITVPAGESTASIQFEIIDDNQVEGTNEVIYFEITSISDTDIAQNFRQATYVYEIEDNDQAPDAALQVDLAWNLGDGVRINAANFDLYLADSVVVNSDGTVSAFHAVDGIQGTNETGFETIMLNNQIADQQYYVIIKYVSGEDPAELRLQFNSSSAHRAAAGTVSSGSAGRTLYYGPITKRGASYTFR
jgi:hypothetical protein